jgi:endonuclease/exonuclease/phosphatase family metal-dependent hydrolase
VIGGAAFATIGILFLLSAIHIFTATLYQSLFGKLPNTSLAAIAFVVFAASGLAIVTAARLGPRRSIAVTATVLALTTLGFTALREEWLDVVLSAAAVVAGTQWLALVHAARPAGRASPLAVALPLAITIDLAARSLFATIPIVASPIVLAVPLVLIAVLLFLASGIAVLGEPLTWTAQGWRGALGLLAVGPVLLVAETGGTNGAQIALAGGIGRDGGPSTQLGLLIVGLGIAAGSLVLARGWPARPAAAAALTAGAVLMWAHVPVLSFAAGAAFAAGILVAAAVLPAAPAGEGRSPWAVALSFAVGWVLFVAGTFVHYAYFANLEALWILTALTVVCVLLVPPSPVARWRPVLAGTIAALAVVVPTAALILTPQPGAVAATAPLTFRVMTYNVHQGFNAFDIADLGRQADTIAREAPDVLVLEEVVRGWLIDEQHDVLGYLSGRLGMPYVFDPTIGDLYGNAILSRYPITDVIRVAYPKEPGLRYQPRGAIFVTVGGVRIIGTHLDENADASAVRMEQVRTLLRAWDGKGPALVLCDCNAKPDAPELKLITESGFGDLALQAGGGANTFSSDDPHERIDYIFGVGVTAAQGHVVDSTASDHKGVVVNVTLSAR